MFDWVPAQAWLMLAITAGIVGPIRYIARHVRSSPAMRDITLPREDLSWRTQGQFVCNLAIVGVLAALAVFLLSPQASDFPRSPYFESVLLAAVGTWVLFATAAGLSRGSITPISRGFFEPYERRSEPKRFWAALGWNSSLGGMCLGLATLMWMEAPIQVLETRCFDHANAYAPQDEIRSCNELIRDHGSQDDGQADYLSARGSAYFRHGDYRRARRDYVQAIRLDPQAPHNHYNLGLVEEELGNREGAIPHYDAAIRLGTDNRDAYVNRGLIFLDSGRWDSAVRDFTWAHDLAPSDPYPLANRGISYTWKGDVVRARQDFDAAQALDASNPVMLRGRALLDMRAGKWAGAVEYLTASLKTDPDNRWALRMRASAYEEMGNLEKAYEDKDALWRLGKKDVAPQ